MPITTVEIPFFCSRKCEANCKLKFYEYVHVAGAITRSRHWRNIAAEIAKPFVACRWW